MNFIKHLLPISDFPGYKVDNLGNVYNKDHKKLHQQINRSGYCMVKLCRNGYEKLCSVHRLVADAFFDGDHDGLEVNHIDGNKQNNRLSNLEWCDRSYNLKHSYEHNLRKSHLTHEDRKKGARISGLKKSKPVRVIETGIIYPSVI